jgi:DNA-binding HxlR family transcriptional regulator
MVLSEFTSRWAVLALAALHEKSSRFGALRRRIDGVSERMLSQTLRTLESRSFVLRNAHDTIPPHVEYSLTPLGKEAASAVMTLIDWIESNLHRIENTRLDPK